MKKYFRKIVLGSALMIANAAPAFSATLFDLHAQHFSTADIGDMTEGRYDLGEVYVSTNLNRVSGSYKTANDAGYFNVDIKSPPNNWGVNLNVDYAFSTYNYESRSLSLIANNGSSIVIGLKRGEVLFNGEDIYDASGFERLTIAISQNEGIVSLVINGSAAVTLDRSDFQGLKSVDVQLVHERYSSTSYSDDTLNSLVIGESD